MFLKKEQNLISSLNTIRLLVDPQRVKNRKNKNGPELIFLEIIKKWF